MTLPVSTALAASLATNRMARDNEVTVLRGAGVPLVRIFAPMLVFGLFTSILGLVISDRVVPWAWKEQNNAQALLDSLPDNPIEAGLTVRVDNYVISFASAQKVSPSHFRVFKLVIVDKGDGTNQFPTIITADTADYEDGVWRAARGIIHHYNNSGFTDFDGVSSNVTMKERVDFSQASTSTADTQADKFSFAELSDLATTAARQGQIRAAVDYQVNRWFKLSLPLMALVFSLCSPPLSLRFARTGAFTGVLLSIITVFVAWNTLLFLKAVGLGGYLPPAVAAWSTNILFAGLGLWLLRKQD
jgi:lipopolysaccharide export system permease protein